DCGHPWRPGPRAGTLQDTLKTLQQQTFKINIYPEETVMALKEKIESKKGERHLSTGQKLIYAGKLLSGDTVLKEYKVDEKNFVVVMVTKPNAVTAPVPMTTQPSNAPIMAAVSSSTSTVVAQAPVPSPASAPTSTPASITPASTTESSVPATQPEKAAEKPAQFPVVTNPARADSTPGDSSRSNLFEDATSALVTTGHHANGLRTRASNCSPESQFQQTRQSFSSSGSSCSYYNATVATSAGGHPLEFLSNQPQFQQMSRIIQQNPSLLPALVQQLGQKNPQLLQQINQLQEHFIQMLNEPVQEAVGQCGGEGGGGRGGGGGGSRGKAVAGSGHMNYIQVTPQEKEPRERLKALGFPEGLVIQAYFACEKNENLAASFLLQQNFDED
ncbi:LOW QUALITY PROTEIN: hypothetical protein U0070_026561, partial [Myodes glareolus]